MESQLQNPIENDNDIENNQFYQTFDDDGDHTRNYYTQSPLQAHSQRSYSHDSNRSTASTTISTRLTQYITGSSHFSNSLIEQTSFYCEICMENVDTSILTVLHQCNGRHNYCRNCVRMYFTTQIKILMVSKTEIKCPHLSCPALASREEIKDIVTAETFDRYNRFLLMKADSNYRECTACLTPLVLQQQQNKQPVSSEKKNILQCSVCGLRTCFVHGDAHLADEACADYVARMVRGEKASLDHIKRIAKKCPGCQCDTEKNLGCNHMTCKNANCNKHWCWLCNRIMESGASHHYLSTNVEGCPGGQNADPLQWAADRRAAERDRLFEQRFRPVLCAEALVYIALIHVVALPCIVLVIPMSLIVAPLMCLLSCMKVCCFERCCTYCVSVERTADFRNWSLYFAHCVVASVVFFLLLNLLVAALLIVAWLPVAVAYYLSLVVCWRPWSEGVGREEARRLFVRPGMQLFESIGLLRDRYHLQWLDV